MDLREINQASLTHHYNRHPWELARIEVAIQTIKNNIPAHLSNLCIIDIGCGDLFALRSISKALRATESIGVDIALSDQDIVHLKQAGINKDIKIFNNLNAITVAKDKTTVILLMDVLEHIEDDKGFLANLSSYDFITKDSIVLITVPSYQSLFCAHDKFLLHYRRYSNQAMIDVVKSQKFNVKSSGYFFSCLLVPRILNVWREKLMPESKEETIDGTGLTHWKGGKNFTAFLKFVLLLDYRIAMFFLPFKIKVPGLSNFVVCKKSV